MLKIISVFYILLASNIHAATGNLLSCKNDRGLLYDCVIKEQTLDNATYPFLVHYNVKYNYSCDSDFYLELDAGNQKIAIPARNSGGARSVKVSGKGPLKIRDTNAFWTLGSYPTLECKISVISTSVEFSNEALQYFTQIENLIHEIKNDKDKMLTQTMKYYSYFTASAGGKNALYCLISDYDEPIYDESILRDLKNLYFTQYGENYIAGRQICPSTIDLNSIILNCINDPLSEIACSHYSNFIKSKKWFSDRIEELNRLKIYALEPMLLEHLEKSYKELQEALSQIPKT